MTNIFDHAHAHWKDIVWMSQNTNQLVDHPEIRRSMHDVIDSGYYSLYPHSKGYPGLPELILEDLGLPSDEYDVLITNGAIEALYIINRATVGRGERMVASDPSFMPIHHQIRTNGGEVDELDIYRDPWKLTPERVEAACGEKTRSILLIDPINPLGTAYTEGEVRAVARIARERELFLVHDITYRDFSPEHHLASSEYPEKTVFAYSFSKTIGFAGMRLGALIAPKELMKSMRPYDTNVLSANMVAQAGAKRALELKKEWLPGMLETAMENQRIIKEAVDKVEGAFIPVYPSRTNMLIIDISETGRNPEKVQETMLERDGVFVRGGGYVSPRFGDRFIRVSFTVSTDGVRRFADSFVRTMTDEASRKP